MLGYLIAQVQQGNVEPVETSDKGLLEAMRPIDQNFRKAEFSLGYNDDADQIALIREDLESLKSRGVTMTHYADILAQPEADWPMILSAGVKSAVNVHAPLQSQSPTIGEDSQEKITLAVKVDGKRFFIPEYGFCRSFEWKIDNHRTNAIMVNPFNTYFLQHNGEKINLEGQPWVKRQEALDQPYVVSPFQQYEGTGKTYSMGLQKISSLCADVYLPDEKRWLILIAPLEGLE